MKSLNDGQSLDVVISFHLFILSIIKLIKSRNEHKLLLFCLIYILIKSTIVMKKNEINKSLQDFKGYEEARKDKRNEFPTPISEKEVKAALNRINPDENNMDRG